MSNSDGSSRQYTSLQVLQPSSPAIKRGVKEPPTVLAKVSLKGKLVGPVS